MTLSAAAGPPWAAITSFHASDWDRYARRMVETFCRFWPDDIELTVAIDGEIPAGLRKLPVTINRAELLAPALARFRSEHGAREIAHGRGQMQGRAVYDYRRDAVKFAAKPLVIEALAARIDHPARLLWLDADTLTHEPVTTAWLDANILPAQLDGTKRGGPMCAYLGRFGSYSECGFLAFDLRHPFARPYLADVADLYRSGRIFQLHEWHDSYLFDFARGRYEAEGLVTCRDLGAGIKHSHVFVNSCLGAKLDHLKGPRKDQGHSNAADLATIRPEAYWQAIIAGVRPKVLAA